MPSFREEVMSGPYNDLKANVMIHSSRFFPRNTHPHFPSFSLSQKHVSTEFLCPCKLCFFLLPLEGWPVFSDVASLRS